MEMKKSILWKVLTLKAHGNSSFLSAIEKACEYAINRSKRVVDTFPLYTLHDEVHICNVLSLMAKLLGNRVHELNRDEAALLILAACFHDIGMSCSPNEKEELLQSYQLKRYMDSHPGAYLKAYDNKEKKQIISDELFRSFLRTIHHELAAALLSREECDWSPCLGGKMKADLIWVCRSHGEDCKDIETDCPAPFSADLRLCAVLLRLADILDFDTSRAPQAIYDYCGFDWVEKAEAVFSKGEWRKHIASHGFRFDLVTDRSSPYELPFSATCPLGQDEQAVNSYLDWVDQELRSCGPLLGKFSGKWNTLVLPSKVYRAVTPDRYLSGQYHFTIDQNQILNLLEGEELYSDPAFFVRDLIQGAIDAVRTREVLESSHPNGWEGKINIRTWVDTEGFSWFRIEDNGTGMTEEIIRTHLLRVGSSYYASDEFKMKKLRSGNDNYTPISRFGIGILSCFMGDKQHSRVEISTKWFGNESFPGLRLRMEGLNGYYTMYSEAEFHHPGEMPGQTPEEKSPYRTEAGTVIAVRTNTYLNGGCKDFKKIVDRYVVYPPVPIHYEGPDGYYKYYTQEELINNLMKIANTSEDGKEHKLTEEDGFEYYLTKEQWDDVRKKWPMLKIKKEISPMILVKCVILNDIVNNDTDNGYSTSPNLGGVIIAPKVDPDDLRDKMPPLEIDTGKEKLNMEVDAFAELNETKLKLNLRLNMPSYGKNKKGFDLLRKKYSSFIKDYFSLKDLASLDNQEKRIKELWENYEDDWENNEKKSDAEKRNWRKEIFKTHNIPKELEDEKNPIWSDLEKFGDKKYSWKEWKTCLVYERGETNMDFIVHDFGRDDRKLNKEGKDDQNPNNEDEWFTKYFRDVEKRCGKKAGVMTHNGIVCGEAYPNAFLLLMDNYRPNMTSSRGKAQLTLETSLECELVLRKLIEEGYNLNLRNIFNEKKYRFLPAKKYLELLERHPKWEDRLAKYTDDDQFPRERTQEDPWIHEKKVEKQHFFASDEKKNKEYLFRFFHMAYLQGKYQLQVEYIENLSIQPIYDPPKTTDDSWKLFPPGLFLPFAKTVSEIEGKIEAGKESEKEDKEKNTDCLCLIFSDNDRYCVCNENHRLSQFLLKNAETLQDKYPGILNQIIFTLAGERGDDTKEKESDGNEIKLQNAKRNELIVKVNEQLKLLQSIPGNPLNVSDHLYLKENDFYLVEKTAKESL